MHDCPTPANAGLTQGVSGLPGVRSIDVVLSETTDWTEADMPVGRRRTFNELRQGRRVTRSPVTSSGRTAGYEHHPATGHRREAN